MGLIGECCLAGVYRNAMHVCAVQNAYNTGKSAAAGLLLRTLIVAH
ncbi:hypothetical protein APY04_2859 [Hyphomicrobium sulfonivorans]|uniref:Uncharacterized protein n=1 Tax=Hyphomicrobium sulfonivorans TaxID=121290 RepID=A0A120CTY3_HYPSL|nr:hypothetical protein APY04_2859 [Hyphomicrobium sulfonivorans]